MPANKNAMTRYKILDDLLSDRYHNYSLDELTEEVSDRLSEMYPNTNGVVRRTIEKDIYYLEYEGPFMVDLERYSAEGYNREQQKSYIKKCIRYRDPSFSIFKKEMSDEEQYLLSEALTILGQFDGIPNLERLEGLRLGLCRGSRVNKSKVISFDKNPLGNSNLLGELFSAISQKQVIEIEYIIFSENASSHKIILYPYLLKEYNRRWFLFACAESDGKILNFALDRIKTVKSLPSHKYVEYEGNLSERFEDIIGVTFFENEPVQDILFWVSDISKDYVITKPIHESQILYKGLKEIEFHSLYSNLKGGAFFSISCKRNYELIRELCSFGKELVVLTPQEIVDDIFDRISAHKEIYEKNSNTNKK